VTVQTQEAHRYGLELRRRENSEKAAAMHE
jgi:hypothetical protein